MAEHAGEGSGELQGPAAREVVSTPGPQVEAPQPHAAYLKLIDNARKAVAVAMVDAMDLTVPERAVAAGLATARARIVRDASDFAAFRHARSNVQPRASLRLRVRRSPSIHSSTGRIHDSRNTVCGHA